MKYMNAILDNYKFEKIHYAWGAMFLSILNWRMRTGGGVGDIWDFYRIGLTVFAAAISINVILTNSARIRRALALPTVLFLIFGFAALLSSMLTEASSTFYSMWKAIEVIVIALLAVATLTTVNPYASARMAIRVLYILLLALILLYVVEAAVWSNEAFIRSRGMIPVIMEGVMPITQQNGLAFYSAFVVFYSFTSYFRVQKTWLKVILAALSIIAFIVLLLAQSRTSFVGLLVALLVYLFFDRKYKSLVFIATVSALILLYFGMSEFLVEYLRRGQDDRLLYSFSGRTKGWGLAWESFKESPLFGHGYIAAAQTSGTSHGMSSMHGAVFDVMVGVGLVGLLPWFGSILSVINRMFKVRKIVASNNVVQHLRSVYATMFGLLAFIIVRTATSSGLAMHDHTTLLFLCIMVYVVSVKYLPKENRTADVESISVSNIAFAKTNNRILKEKNKVVIN